VWSAVGLDIPRFEPDPPQPAVARDAQQLVVVELGPGHRLGALAPHADRRGSCGWCVCILVVCKGRA
jgi:hypothetical protein